MSKGKIPNPNIYGSTIAALQTDVNALKTSSKHLIEEKTLSFNSGGWCLVFTKSDYVLAAAYPINRPTTEAGTYAITIYGRTDGYFLKSNSDAAFSMQCRLVWIHT